MGVTIINLQNKLPVYQNKIKGIIKRILSSEGTFDYDISVTVATDRRIRKLNKRFLRRDRPTDVLAFNFIDDKSLKKHSSVLLADVIVSADTAISNAKIYKTSPQEELYLYVIHGVLHLLGYDDSTVGKQKLMRKKEKQYIKK